MKKIKTVLIVLVSIFGLSFTVVNNDKLFEIAKNIELFVEVYKKLNTDYADEVDPGTLMKTGIDAMVKSLDPYTIYWSDSQMASGRINSERRYLSIGATIDQINDQIIITDVESDGPAGKEGVLSGDILLKINGRPTDEQSLERVKSQMKGVSGSKMNLLIQRNGLSNPFSVTVERGGKNTDSNVPYYGLVGNDIGYVNLSTFTANASKNIKDAINEMNEKDNLKGIILDLRYNGGGLLREAIAVSNLFIPKDLTVVSTKNKIEGEGRTYKTRSAPLDKDIPLVVLVNHRSASASDIVSGVMQDYDRGVIIGEQSFGKGLVQNFQQLGYSAQMKLTTHKYYLPSKRCIQKYYYENGEAKEYEKNDWVQFTTKNGRKVYDASGVTPDILIEKQEKSAFLQALLNDNIIFDYVNKYVAKHKKISDAEKYKFDDFKDFKNFVKKSNFKYQSTLEKELIALKDKELSDLDKAKIDKMIDGLSNKKPMLKQYQKEIEREIAAQIVERYYNKQGKIQFLLEGDKDVNEAINVLHNPSKYNKILNQ